MSDWDDLVEPARAAFEELLRNGDAMADRIEELEAKLAQLTEHNKSQAKPANLGTGLPNSVNDTAP
jgi:hypothetical protein